MNRVVLDTNVIVSALLTFFGAQATVLTLALTRLSHTGQAEARGRGENTGDRRLRPRGAEGHGASTRNGARLGAESSVPAFSQILATTKSHCREMSGLTGHVALYVSTAVRAEYGEVLQRPQVDGAMAAIRTVTVPRDESGNRFLECAEAAGADWP